MSCQIRCDRCGKAVPEGHAHAAGWVTIERRGIPVVGEGPEHFCSRLCACLHFLPVDYELHHDLSGGVGPYGNTHEYWVRLRTGELRCVEGAVPRREE